MKTIHIVLLALIVLGIGLLVIQQMSNTTVEVSDVTNSPITASDMDQWNWVPSEMTLQGTQFKYPNPWPVAFVTPENWPPQVTLAAGDFSCPEPVETVATSTNKGPAPRTIGGEVYCVAKTSEGAAGSVYTDYEYVTKRGDYVATISFTLRSPQCVNYDEPEQGVCKGVQANFDVDALVHQIAGSITTSQGLD